MKGSQEQQVHSKRRKMSESELMFNLESPLTLRRAITILVKIIDNRKEETKGMTYDKYKGGEERR